MKQVAEGSQAVSEAVRLAKVQVIAAYPITPQTHIVENLSEHCANGTLNARFICVESEHSAMAALIGAASSGVRTFTASSSHGLAYMHELLHWASGARLPIVMTNVNRALGPGWNIWLDQTDSLSQRDTGWIQLYCEDSQDALDTTLIAYRLAESVNLPVMVVLDAFFLSHTYEPVDIPDQKTVDAFLPPLSPRFQLDTANPAAINLPPRKPIWRCAIIFKPPCSRSGKIIITLFRILRPSLDGTPAWQKMFIAMTPRSFSLLPEQPSVPVARRWIVCVKPAKRPVC